MWNEEVTKELIRENGHTASRLLQSSMSKAKDELIKLGQQIRLRIKTLMQLQQSYEALVNRSIMQDRALSCTTICSNATLRQSMFKKSSK